MEELRIFEKIQEAYRASTPSNNRFERTIKAIKWDDTFYEDGEHYFVRDELCLTTPSLDPFNMPYEPMVTFADASVKFIK